MPVASGAAQSASSSTAERRQLPSPQRASLARRAICPRRQKASRPRRAGVSPGPSGGAAAKRRLEWPLATSVGTAGGALFPEPKTQEVSECGCRVYTARRLERLERIEASVGLSALREAPQTDRLEVMMTASCGCGGLGFRTSENRAEMQWSPRAAPA